MQIINLYKKKKKKKIEEPYERAQRLVILNYALAY